jgi:hypothetical protein
MSTRFLMIAVCVTAVAGCNGGSGNNDAGVGGSAGGTTGVSGSGGGAGGRGGGAAGAAGGIAGAGGASDTAGTGGGAAGAGGRGGGAGTGGQGGGAGGQGGSCAFASTYTIVDGGGLVIMLDTATLSPPAGFHYERQFFRLNDAGNISCSPAMPACRDSTRVDVSDVEAAIAHPDVQAALAMATRPIYGNRGVADAPSFNFTRADGRGFSAGIPCSPASALCTPIPAGVSALAEVIRMLIDQQLTDASCAALR